MRILGAVIIAALTGLAAPATAQNPLTAAAGAAELQQMCNEDRARLWGVDLCGPLLVVDPATREAWASQPDRDGVLSIQGAGYAGRLPEGVGIANTSVNWAGVRWIMVMGPLPTDATERRVLVAHEAWHRVQNLLGLPQSASDCAHLETERGRYLMRLEFRALSTALRSRGAARREAARDALMFRAVRISEFANAASQEAALDRNEGLASYTGVKLGAGANAEMFAARTLDRSDHHAAFARAYAYSSGPAYGLLLDEMQPAWRTTLAGNAPADLLVPILRPPAFEAERFYRIAGRYGGEVVATEELQRAQTQRARIVELRQRFAEGPRLSIGLRRMQMEFDPNQVTPVEGLGNFYGVLTVRDAWGELRATEGALISSDLSRIILPAPSPSGFSGPGWTVIPAAGAVVGAPDASGVRTLSAP
jgi:hypothetical protein